MSEVENLAAQLGADQKRALMMLNGEWSAGPRLPAEVLDHLSALRHGGLVDRQFADDTPVTITAGTDTVLTARVSACWFFRLTPLGMKLRDHLAATASEGA